MRITYLYNSGFSVFADRLLVFDYCKDTGAGSLEAQALPKNAVAFFSHSHGDHMTQKALNWPVTKVVSEDFRVIPAGTTVVRPGDVVQVQGLTIRAFGSTDLGVSFLVDGEGYRLFHAGDLNLWSWREESSAQEIAQATGDFTKILDTIKPYADTIDVAFFPVDHRMGTGYDEGAHMFLAQIRPSLFIPMHFREEVAPVEAFAQKARAMGHKIQVIAQEGQYIDI